MPTSTPLISSSRFTRSMRLATQRVLRPANAMRNLPSHMRCGVSSRHDQMPRGTWKALKSLSASVVLSPATLHAALDQLYQEIDVNRFDPPRSEERRVGKECRSRLSPYH